MRHLWFSVGSLVGCLIMACSSASQDRADESSARPATPGSEVHGDPAQAGTLDSTPARVSASATSPARTEPADDEAAYTPIVKRAREALAAANVVGAADARVISVEPHQWSDSSLGCRRPGESYLQMITSGHVVTFDIGGVPTAVNVAGDAAVYCVREGGGQATGDARLPKRPNYPVRAATLERVTKEAREDLAAKTGLPLDEIKVVATVPFVWEDGSFRCGSSSDTRQQVRGYKLQLTHGADSYTYHTDFKSTFACPAVGTE